MVKAAGVAVGRGFPLFSLLSSEKTRTWEWQHHAHLPPRPDSVLVPWKRERAHASRAHDRLAELFFKQARVQKDNAEWDVLFKVHREDLLLPLLFIWWQIWPISLSNLLLGLFKPVQCRE